MRRKKLDQKDVIKKKEGLKTKIKFKKQDKRAKCQIYIYICQKILIGYI